MSLKYNFEGRRVLVTGGGKGLGYALIKTFIESGCKSIYTIEKDETTLKELLQEFPFVKGVQVDVAKWEETGEAVKSFGPVDILINNAGIGEPEDFLEITPEGIARIFGVNFNAIVNISQVVARGMIQEGKGGAIVNVSSVVDEKAVKGISMYSCTKAAVTTLTKTMALELAPHNIRVNCVKPAVMLTHLIQNQDKKHVAEHIFDKLMERQVTKRVLTVEDTCNSILFLCSEASSMVNGSDILVDGGIYTH